MWGPNGSFIANSQSEPHWLPAADGSARNPAFDVDRRDAEFIAHAREDIPLLMRCVDEATDTLGAINAMAGTWILEGGEAKKYGKALYVALDADPAPYPATFRARGPEHPAGGGGVCDCDCGPDDDCPCVFAEGAL